MPNSTALLNWASLYSTISPFLSSVSGSSDWLRVFISPDSAGGGHFITHGIDFGASYVGGQRGLVPANGGTLDKTFLRGDGWSALWTQALEDAAAGSGTAAQQAANREQYLMTTLVSAKTVKDWIAASFAANDAMRFKGVISIDNSENISTITESGTTSSFPTTCLIGDTYKISGESQSSSSYIGGQYVSSGDLAICIKAGSGANLNDAQYWTIVQDNVEHLITYTINGNAHYLYAQSGDNITLYAPATAGVAGQVLLSSGSGAPVWANQNTLIVAEAAKVTHALTAGNGIGMTNQGTNTTNYDGSATIVINVLAATTSTIGGVIIDNGEKSILYDSATPANKYPTVSVDSNGVIYLTHTNITNALGYDPSRIFSTTYDGLVPMASTANRQTSGSDNIITDTTFVLGADAKWYKLPTSAFIGTWRNIKVNGTEILDTDVTGAALDLIAGTNVTLTPGTGANAGKVTIASSWRDIQVRKIANNVISNNVESIQDNNPVVFDNTETIFTIAEEVTVGSTTKTVIKNYITWYNMDTGEYELV